MTTRLTSLLKEWIDLDAELKKGRVREKEIINEKTKLQEVILDQWAEEGTSGQDILGRYIYAHHELYVGAKKVIHPATGEEVIPWGVVSKVLRDCGFEEFVQEKFDSRTIATVFREIVRDPDQDLPQEIRDHFNIFEKRSLRSKKGK